MAGTPAVWYQTADGIRPFADGQVIYGSPAAGGDMVLQSNPTETPGQVRLVGLNTRLVDFIRQDTGGVLGYLRNGGQGAGDGLGFYSNSHAHIETPSGYGVFTSNLFTQSNYAGSTGHRITAAASQTSPYIDCQTSGGTSVFRVIPGNAPQLLLAGQYNTSAFSTQEGLTRFTNTGYGGYLEISPAHGNSVARYVSSYKAHQFNGTIQTEGAGHRLHIGQDARQTATAQAKIAVGNAAWTGLIVEGASGQTANGFEQRRSDGVTTFAVDAAGLVTGGHGFALGVGRFIESDTTLALRSPTANVQLTQASMVKWSNQNDAYTGITSFDAALARYAANSAELNNGTAGGWGSTTLRAGNFRLPSNGQLVFLDASLNNKAMQMFAFSGNEHGYIDMLLGGDFHFRNASTAEMFRVNNVGGTQLWTNDASQVGHVTNLATGQTANARETRNAANVLIGVEYSNGVRQAPSFQAVQGFYVILYGGYVGVHNNTRHVFNETSLSTYVSTIETTRVDDDDTAGNTRLLLWDVDTDQLQRVKVGANGSGPGGSGRALYLDAA